MKKRLSFMLALVAALLCACGGTASTTQNDGADTAEPMQTVEISTAPSVTVLDFYKSTHTLSETREGEAICSVTYPELALSQEDAEKYPVLARSITALNADGAQNSTDAYAQLLAAAEGALARRAQQAATEQEQTPDTPEEENEFECFYRNDDLVLPRADSRVVSILYSMASFSGGTHSDIYYYTTNLDTVTGRVLNVNDVVLNMADFRDVLEGALKKTYPKAEFAKLEDALNAYFSDPTTFSWTLDYEGLSFYFSAGELSSYEDGKMICSLRFEDNPSLYSEYYTATPTNYAVPLIEGRSVNLDINADGASDEISIEPVYEKDGEGIEKLIINVNGKEYTANTPMLDCTVYAVNIASARYYLFVSAQNLTGYGYVSVYKLDRTGASLVGMLYESSLYAAGYAPVCAGVPLLTDPDSFVLGTRQQYLGTLTGLKTYALGTDGMPTSADAYYQLYGAQPLTLKRQLVTATIDASGSGTFAAETLAAGTKLNFLRSDGAGGVDMYTDDGTYCRLYVSGKVGSQRINGMAAEDVFDGIEY